MDKQAKLEYILSLVKENIDEFLEFEKRTGVDMSAEEILIAAVELATSIQITRPTYQSPVGYVDRANVSFMVDDEMSVPIYGDTDDPD